MKKIIPAIILLLMFGCSGGKPANGRKVSRSEFGAAWPFTVDEGYLECKGVSVIFTSNEITYAVNGAAKSFDEYKDIIGIWAVDTSYHDLSIRKDIGPIIDAGLKLCEQK